MTARKPHPDFPLTPHGRGWVKKYKGRVRYCGPANDPYGALANWQRIKREIDSGREPRKQKHGQRVTVREVGNLYLFDRRADRDAGKLSPGTYDDYGEAAADMTNAIGGDVLVSELTPDHWTRLFREWERRRLGAHALARRVQAIRTLFRHSWEAGWIDSPMRFGPVFKKPMAGKRTGVPFTDLEVVKLIDGCPKKLRHNENIANAKHYPNQLRAMIYLATNCGYGAGDCAKLPREVAAKTGALVFPRPKMERRQGIDRAAVLWTETRAAIDEVLLHAKPNDLLAFRTLQGHPWVRDETSRTGKAGHTDSVGLMFRRLCKSLGVAPRGFYWLRHWCATAAAELEMPLSTARVLGHRLPGMSAVYVDSVEHGNLQLISDHLMHRIAKARRALAAGAAGHTTSKASQAARNPKAR